MKYIAILLAMLPMYAQAATCYGSADCQRQQKEQIEEANRKQLEEIRKLEIAYAKQFTSVSEQIRSR